MPRALPLLLLTTKPVVLVSSFLLLLLLVASVATSSSFCPVGTWGNPPACDRFCASKCRGSACDASNGTCTDPDCGNHPPFDGGGPSPGFWGPMCLTQCPQFCALPFSGGRPSVAAPIIYNACDRHTGVCLFGCAIGYWGSRCDKFCPGFDGKYGVELPTPCTQDEGNLYCNDPDCYGPNCTLRCPNCASPQSVGLVPRYSGNCDPVSGRCLAGCKLPQQLPVFAAYTGPFCNASCAKECVIGGCAQDNASECTCPGGRGNWGPPKCESPCPSGCPGSCHPLTGECFACLNGTGVFCNASACPDNCAEESVIFQLLPRCDMKTGKCLACKPGFFGPKCERNCNTPASCSDEYGPDESCAQTTGACSACTHKSHTFGAFCNFSCPATCDQCAFDDGHCLRCALPRWGGTCESVCSSNCAYTKDYIFEACSRTSGWCVNGCVDGRWGSGDAICGAKCGNCAGGGVCNEKNGSCSLELGCAQGWWGVFCNTSCSKACARGVCHMLSGECPFGCTSSLAVGKNCTLPTGSGSNSGGGGGSSNSNGKLFIGVAAAGAVVLVVLLVWLVNRRRQSDSYGEDDRLLPGGGGGEDDDDDTASLQSRNHEHFQVRVAAEDAVGAEEQCENEEEEK